MSWAKTRAAALATPDSSWLQCEVLHEAGNKIVIEATVAVQDWKTS